MDDINADDAEFGMSDHKTHNELRAEIASLRAELAAANARIEHVSQVLVDAEELLGVEETGELILRPIERLIAGARQDADTIEALRRTLDSVRSDRDG